MIIKRFIYLSNDNDNDNEHFYFCQNLNIIIEKIDFCLFISISCLQEERKQVCKFLRKC